MLSACISPISPLKLEFKVDPRRKKIIHSYNDSPNFSATAAILHEYYQVGFHKKLNTYSGVKRYFCYQDFQQRQRPPGRHPYLLWSNSHVTDIQFTRWVHEYILPKTLDGHLFRLSDQDKIKCIIFQDNVECKNSLFVHVLGWASRESESSAKTVSLFRVSKDEEVLGPSCPPCPSCTPFCSGGHVGHPQWRQSARLIIEGWTEVLNSYDQLTAYTLSSHSRPGLVV